MLRDAHVPSFPVSVTRTLGTHQRIQLDKDVQYLIYVWTIQGRLPMGGWDTNLPPIQKWGLCFADQIWGLPPETFLTSRYAKNPVSAGAPPWIPLGELTALPKTPYSWI